MKKVLAIAVLLMVITATMAVASVSNWMLYMYSDSTDGGNFGLKAQMGIKGAAADAWDSLDGIPIDFTSGDSAMKWTGAWLAGDPDGSPNLYSKTLKATAGYAAVNKKFEYLVGGLSGSSGPIRFRFQTGTSTITLAPQEVTTGAGAFYYTVTLKGNPKAKSVVKPAWAVGAGDPWAVDEKVVIDVPTGTNVWFGEMILPESKVTPNENAEFAAQAYRFEFAQEPVPEPSSLMILGTGLAGLVGFVSRRRRS